MYGSSSAPASTAPIRNTVLVCSSTSVSMASSTVTKPTTPAILLNDRHSQQIVLADFLNGILSGLSTPTVTGFGSHDLADRLGSIGHHQIAQRNRAEQAIGSRLDDVTGIN